MAGYASALRLLDASRVRATLIGVRAAPPSPDHDPDPALVDLLERPFRSVDGAYDRLADLESRLRAAGDRRAVFLTVYTRMTDAVRGAIADGRFDDAAWMRRYTVSFADYYRRAFRSFERGDHAAVPAPWRVAFGTALAGDALVAQDAFLGINAHINYDLALTLRDLGIDPDRERKHADHDRIDGVLAGLVDAQQAALADLYAPGLSTVDTTFGRFDEAFSLFSMTEGRAWAWRTAVALTDVGWAPARTAVRWLHRTTATGSAHTIRSPPVDPTVMAALRRVERDRFSLDDALDALAAELDAVT
ncbi:DUF5995 family protein [Haloplanus halophilus]|uniref:DUF5995 family protein n=1 Tax=Haloplanus halophilus TaxID=2949993 RepID=UPI00203FB694|nr:DUF5995 family protein [Haloplanus sp. GDY1]